MDASKLNALLTANGGWTNVVYISLNNGKQLGYRVSFDSVTSTKATITITKG